MCSPGLVSNLINKQGQSRRNSYAAVELLVLGQLEASQPVDCSEAMSVMPLFVWKNP
jgi:hypothetical protein